jgi:hypothetical protein
MNYPLRPFRTCCAVLSRQSSATAKSERKRGARASRPQCLASRRTHLRPTWGARVCTPRIHRSKPDCGQIYAGSFCPGAHDNGPNPLGGLRGDFARQLSQTMLNLVKLSVFGRDSGQIVCKQLTMNGLQKFRCSVRSNPVKLNQTDLKGCCTPNQRMSHSSLVTFRPDG